jgi:beta-phosphoglucomutase family hydrolase
MSVQAVIFDMDGTVVDTTELEYKAWSRMMREQGVEFTHEEYIKVLGAKGSEIVKKHLDWDEDAIQEILQNKEKYFKELVAQHGLELIPGVEKVLQDIQQIPLKMALATGASRKKLEFVLEQLPIGQYFDAMITADDTQTGKPDPEVFLNAAKKLGVPPDSCIVMEDARNGAQAAKKGHMICIAITTTRGKDQLPEADLVVNRYEELDIRDFVENQSKGKAQR